MIFTCVSCLVKYLTVNSRYEFMDANESLMETFGTIPNTFQNVSINNWLRDKCIFRKDFLFYGEYDDILGFGRYNHPKFLMNGRNSPRLIMPESYAYSRYHVYDIGFNMYYVCQYILDLKDGIKTKSFIVPKNERWRMK